MNILYCDNLNHPAFYKTFIRCGVENRSWYKCRFSQYLYEQIYLKHKFAQKDWVKELIFYYPKKRTPPDKKDIIVVFDSKLWLVYLKELIRRRPDARIIIWCWNPMKTFSWIIGPRMPSGIDIWSYSREDADLHGLLYGGQFYFDSILKKYGKRRTGKCEGKESFIFLGRNKGREERLNAVADDIRAAGWDCELDFYKGSLTETQYDQRKQNVKYEVFLERTLKYQGILDMQAFDHAGLSLRVMESIFFDKKLITDQAIVKEYDFYDPNNIYVYGTDTEPLSEFLKKEYRPVPDEIRNYYLFSNWKKRLEDYYETETA